MNSGKNKKAGAVLTLSRGFLLRQSGSRGESVSPAR